MYKSLQIFIKLFLCSHKSYPNELINILMEKLEKMAVTNYAIVFYKIKIYSVYLKKSKTLYQK